ncbi:MAG: SpoIIE family protein phosphatase [Proteobacteria bacterium]|nr:SpoIIE family protein phosphatase [Pseudomonadota bacterium]
MKTEFAHWIRCWSFFGLLWLIPPTFSSAAPPVVLDEGRGMAVLGKHLDILEDKEGNLTMVDVSSPEFEPRFIPSRSEIPNFGHTESVYWFRVDLTAGPKQSEKEWVLELANPLIDWVDLYAVDPRDACWSSKDGCDMAPFKDRRIVHSSHVFHLKPGRRQRLYLQVLTAETMKIPLIVWTPEAFAAKVEDVNFWGGVFLGVLLVMALYNLFLYFSVRDGSYLYYVLFIVSYVLAMDSGDKLLWQSFPWWINRIIPFSLGLTGFCLALFSRSYLNSRKYSPWLDKALLFFALESAVMALLSSVLSVGLVVQLARLFLLLEYTTILVSGIVCRRRGHRAAGYFMIAILPILVGFILSGLTNFGILPVNNYTVLIPSFGSIVGIILFSLGLGDRVNIERQAKILAQQKAVENLEEANRLKSRMLATVEKEVEERTHELNLTLTKVEEVNKQVMDSIEYARRIQGAILPDREKIRTFLPHHFIIWMPRDIVSGDVFFLDYVEDGYLIGVIDCTGHGVPGAFMTMIASSGLQRIVRDEGRQLPADILRRLNFIVKTSLQQDKDYAQSDDGLDAAICLVKPKEKVLVFAGARLPLIVVHQDRTTVIKGDRQSIGYKRSNLEFDFQDHVVELEKDMAFYLYTDGWVDQLGGDKFISFGRNRLTELLKKHYREPFETQRIMLLQAFNDYKSDAIQQDDITIVGFKPDA